MPTGYADKVESGEMTTLKEYVLRCASAFGGDEFRDENGMPIFDPQPNDYYRIEYEDAEERFIKQEKVTEEEFAESMKADLNNLIEQRKKAIEEERIKLDRYAAMAEKLERWNPPRSCKRLKEFAGRQLEISMRPIGGCAEFYDTLIKLAKEKADKVEASKEALDKEMQAAWHAKYGDMARAKERWDEATGRVENWKTFLNELAESLDEFEVGEMIREGRVKSAWNFMEEGEQAGDGGAGE